MKQTTALVISLIFIFVIVVGVFIFQTQDNSNEPKAKVLTKFGCLEISDTINEFHNKQDFYRMLYGSELKECS